MHRTILLCTFIATSACDKGAEASSAKSETKTAAVVADKPAEKAKAPAPSEPKPAETKAAAEPPKTTTPVLEEADLPGIGKLKMPKGFESTADKHWSFDLGNYESISVSWEPHGAPNLKKAESLSNILATAETVASKKTLDSGFHEIERVRKSDGFTFIAVFGPDWYVKCVAPAAQMEVCREIVRSKK
ncbi:MAG TPA: hypothetical protein VG755_37045 [Nannocystaceae bacterium]|nr:hypothetical protein [Nannocystaceae bacterium]